MVFVGILGDAFRFLFLCKRRRLQNPAITPAQASSQMASSSSQQHQYQYDDIPSDYGGDVGGEVEHEFEAHRRPLRPRSNYVLMNNKVFPGLRPGRAICITITSTFVPFHLEFKAEETTDPNDFKFHMEFQAVSMDRKVYVDDMQMSSGDVTNMASYMFSNISHPFETRLKVANGPWCEVPTPGDTPYDAHVNTQYMNSTVRKTICISKYYARCAFRRILPSNDDDKFTADLLTDLLDNNNLYSIMKAFPIIAKNACVTWQIKNFLIGYFDAKIRANAMTAVDSQHMRAVEEYLVRPTRPPPGTPYQKRTPAQQIALDESFAAAVEYVTSRSPIQKVPLIPETNNPNVKKPTVRVFVSDSETNYVHSYPTINVPMKEWQWRVESVQNQQRAAATTPQQPQPQPQLPQPQPPVVAGGHQAHQQAHMAAAALGGAAVQQQLVPQPVPAPAPPALTAPATAAAPSQPSQPPPPPPGVDVMQMAMMMPSAQFDGNYNNNNYNHTQQLQQQQHKMNEIVKDHTEQIERMFRMCNAMYAELQTVLRRISITEERLERIDSRNNNNGMIAADAASASQRYSGNGNSNYPHHPPHPSYMENSHPPIVRMPDSSTTRASQVHPMMYPPTHVPVAIPIDNLSRMHAELRHAMNPQFH